MLNNYYTIVIPTRERCDTLIHSLHTCVSQDYDNMEILVSDNFSEDKTREVVDSFQDKRIRYINTGKRLSMTANYEFALSHVKKKGYVIYIGDDDGLLPNAISDINTIINKTDASVLHWDMPHYWWPNIEGGLANRLIIPSLKNTLISLNSDIQIRKVLSFKKPYNHLPIMYICSAVKYEIIEIIKNKSGRFYHSMTPDVYSGFAIAGSIDSYYYSKRPFTIGGASKHSTGASQLGKSISEPVLRFLSENDLPFHKDLIYANNLKLIIVESFFQARDNLRLPKKYAVDMRKLIHLMMKEASSKSIDSYNDTENVVLRLGEMYNNKKDAEKAIKKYKYKAKVNIIDLLVKIKSTMINDILREYLCIEDCLSFNVKNIYEASLLCYQILKLKDNNRIGFITVIKSRFINIYSAISFKRKMGY